MTEILLDIQQNLKAPKNKKNTFAEFNYRNLEGILEAVKPLLKKHNAVLVLSDTIVPINDRVYVMATAVLSAGDKSIQSTAWAREQSEKKKMDEAQITGAASSYARKYALNGLFAIDDTRDADDLPPDEEPKNKQETPKQATHKQVEVLLERVAQMRDTPKSVVMSALCNKLGVDETTDLKDLNANNAVKVLKAWEKLATGEN